MNKYEFITNLQRHLTGKVSAEKLQELTAYYNDYIDAQIRKGRTEEEVLLELGDPRLLAKSIVETEGGSRGGDGLRANTVYEEGGPEEGDRQSHGKRYLPDRADQPQHFLWALCGQISAGGNPV